MYLLPTIHPAAVLRGVRPIGEAISADLGKAWRIANEGPKLEEHLLFPVPGCPQGITKAWEQTLEVMRGWAARPCRLGVDVETSALDYFKCKLYSIALGEAETGVAVAFTLHDFHTLPPSYEAALVDALRCVLGSLDVEKVFHNAPFDLAVLFHKGYQVNGRFHDTQGMHHLIQPDIPHDLGWVGQTYLDVEPWKLDHESGKMANTKDPVKLLVYNARDALYTAMLVEPMLEHISALGMSTTLASWQAEYARLATDMETYGIPINHDKRRARGAMLKNKMAEKRAWLREFLNWPDFNPMADAHRREALLGRKYAQSPWDLGLKPTKFTKKTNKPSTSYKAIIDYLEHPFVRALADYVDSHMAYATQFRDGTQLDLDGKREAPGGYQRAIIGDRIYPRWKPNTLRSVRYGSDPNCLAADTELLTMQGWLPFPEAKRLNARPIQYWHENDVAMPAPGGMFEYVEKEAEDWIEVQSGVADIKMTLDHRMLMLRESRLPRRGWLPDSENKFWQPEVLSAVAFASEKVDSKWAIPTRSGGWWSSAHMDNGQYITDAEIAVLCACQADGWRRKYGDGEAWSFYFTKKRKIKRLTRALKDLGLAADWYEKALPPNGARASRKPQTAVYLKACHIKHWVDGLLGPEKKFGPWLLAWNTDSLKRFVHEASQWDGRSDRATEYSSTVKGNVDWVQIAAVLSGAKAGHTREFRGSESKKPCYQVSAGWKSRRTIISRQHVSSTTGLAKAYCVSVPSGFIIVRRNGKACITGNCQNQRTLAPGADPMTCDRVMFEAPPGRTFVGSDKDQLELRIVACRAGERELLDEMLRPGGDPHRLACRMVYGDAFIKATPEQQKMLRTIMKNVVYASLYLAGPVTVWRTIRERKQLDPAIRASMTLPVVRHAHSSYFMHFSRINRYNEWLIDQATNVGYSEIPPFGRRRYFPIKPVPATEVASWNGQCPGAEIVTSEMCQIQYELKRRYHGRASIIAHKHDELNIECDEKDAEAISKLVKDVFGNTRLEGPAGPVFLSADANIDRNMATLK